MVETKVLDKSTHERQSKYIMVTLLGIFVQGSINFKYMLNQRDNKEDYW